MVHGKTNMLNKIRGYNLWLGYGNHKWFGKWGYGKDWRWYLYRVWMWIGSTRGYIRKYNMERDTSMENAKRALEKAFTPQLKSMLKEKYKDG